MADHEEILKLWREVGVLKGRVDVISDTVAKLGRPRGHVEALQAENQRLFECVIRSLRQTLAVIDKRLGDDGSREGE